MNLSSPLRAITLAACLLAAQLAPVAAQPQPSPGIAQQQWSPVASEQESSPIAAQQQPAPNRPDWHALRIAKWTVAAASAGSALYGFLENRRADDRYDRLEQMCMQDVVVCAARQPDGSYIDPALEAEYQAVRRLDGRARTALIAGQVGVAATVVLFILDLRNTTAPDNIPYEPRNLDVGPAADGGLRLTLRLGF